jgi:pimeloyl-ACP methyl ester carboxylesterase
MLRLIVQSAFVALVFAAGLPYLIPNPNLNGAIPEQPFADSHFDEFGGTRLHWRSRSPDQARALVILLHGFGGSGFSWRSSLDTLEAEGYHVLAPDLPPFGYSERRAGGPDWPALVIALAEAQGAELPWILVGHSMGVSVAAQVAGRRSDRVAGLIMVGGTPGLQHRGAGWSWLFGLPPVGRWAEVWAARNLVSEASISDMLTSALGRPPTAEEFDGYYRPLTIPGTYPALLGRMSRRGEISDDWMATPHALIWGAFDRWVPIERAQQLIDRLPEPVDLQIIEEAAHNPMDTHPEAFDACLKAQIERFLAAAEGPAEEPARTLAASEPE